MTKEVATNVGLVAGASSGIKLKEFLDLGALFDGHIAREFADHDVNSCRCITWERMRISNEQPKELGY